MYNGSANPTLISCRFVANTAGRNAGAIWNKFSTPKLVNCTLVRNTAGKYGGAIYDHPNPARPEPMRVSNCIFWANADSKGTGHASQIHAFSVEEIVPVVNSTCIQGGWSGAGMGNIDRDPLLTPDGHLRAGSPCIGVGMPDVGVDVETDIDGEPRSIAARIVAHADSARIDHGQKHILSAFVAFPALLAHPASVLIAANAANSCGRLAADVASDVRRLVSGHDAHFFSLREAFSCRYHLDRQLGRGSKVIQSAFRKIELSIVSRT